MASTTVPNFLLTPQQQSLLFAALTSGGNLGSTGLNGIAPGSLNTASAPNTSVFSDTSFLDNFDYDNGPESSFDLDMSTVDGPKAKADAPGESQSPSESIHEGDNADKRSHPDEDDGAEEVSPKRRESEEKVPKKPGRKPIMSEPSSKRKAQNRAAQRAFRERKEKHLKDLETKVEELEKESQQANNENAVLKAQLERMTAELNQYKKQVTLLSNSRSTSRELQTFGNPILNNLNDVNFHFEFPKFGQLPGPRQGVGGGPSPQRQPSSARSPTNGIPSPGDSATPGSMTNGASPPVTKLSTDFGNLPSGFFNPPLTGSVVADASRGSLDSARQSVSGAAPNAGSSPSASSHSNQGGPSSSCGTSPEPSAQSPMGFKPVDTLTTIGEEQPAMSIFGGGSSTNTGATGFGQLDASGTPAFDLTNFDWLAQQNGGQFDPQLFTDYREPHDNILAGSAFDDSFFSDAFDFDFTTPYNVPVSLPTPGSSGGASQAQSQAPKVDLIAQIDAAKDGDEAAEKKYITCTKIWDRLQDCERVKSGDFDLDGLCKDLQSKARCSGGGPVVDEETFGQVVKKYLGDSAGCLESKKAH